MPAPHAANTAPAVEALKRYADERAIDDPVKLQRAARIIRFALQRGRLTLDEILPSDVDNTPRDASPIVGDSRV